jgi:hypothetical protein
MDLQVDYRVQLEMIDFTVAMNALVIRSEARLMKNAWGNEAVDTLANVRS